MASSPVKTNGGGSDGAYKAGSTIISSVPLLSERKEPPNLLVCQSWWKTCLVQGDQYKKVKHLYSKKTKLVTLRSKENEAFNTKVSSDADGGETDSADVTIDSGVTSISGSDTALVSVVEDGVIGGFTDGGSSPYSSPPFACSPYGTLPRGTLQNIVLSRCGCLG